MSKHSLYPAPLPPAKRIHTTLHSVRTVHELTFENVFNDELILCILSYLNSTDLCAVQATSWNLYRLAADNELWRSLYLSVFGRLRLRGGRGFPVAARSDGKEVKPLPGRASGHKDWKWMFRISSNWRRGRCAVEPLSDASDPAENHILLTGSLTITAGRSSSEKPVINLLYASSQVAHTIQTFPSSYGACSITQLALDQSHPASGSVRLAAFFSNGDFSIFLINSSTPSQSEMQFTYAPSRRTGRTAPVVGAAYHHPLLITLSESFGLCIYDLSTEQVKLVQTLTSFSSYPPISLVLSAPSTDTYKLVLAHTVPVYPSHWSVAATEFMISGSESSQPNLSTPTSFLVSTSEFVPLSIMSTRRTRAIDTPQGWIDDQKLRLIHEQASRKVLRVADTQTDGKWVVLAPADHPLIPSSQSRSSFTSPSSHSQTNLQLYRLSLPPPVSVASSKPKLTFVRTLSGQTGPISAISVSDGRCVSLGQDGSIWVWDLESGTEGAQVSGPRIDTSSKGSPASPARGTITFDDRRIITSEGGRTVVRRFDI